MTTSKGHMPGGKWEFDAEVTGCFDDMLKRSIPGYVEMRDLVFELGCRFVRDDHAVVDLGCSRGESLARFAEAFHGVKCIGIETSQPMVAAAVERFRGQHHVEIFDLDLRRSYPEVSAALTLSVLTLQFTPIEYRQQIVHKVWESTAPGGAFIVVEKVLGHTAPIDELLCRTYWDRKERAGYSTAEIDRKRLALEGVLVPVTARWNEELLLSAGFRSVECFWRTLNFAGWVALK